MERKVSVIHTTVVTCDGINSRLKALVPDAEVMNIVDDSLLNDVKKEGMLTKEVTRRLLTYALEAQDWGAELIPYFKIDEPMARIAVEKGEKIAVYGTVKTTLEPSARLISRIAEAEKKKVVVDSYLASDAFEALTVEKNQEKHNQILESLIRNTGNQYDVLVLAQASMSVLIPCLADITKPILSSMDSGVEAAAKALKGL